MPQIDKMTETHHQMLQWLMQNPGRTLREMSEHFGYSVPWLSTVINSDIFQTRLAALQEASDVCVIADIPAKLRGVTAQALDIMGEHLEEAAKSQMPMTNRDYVKACAELGLKALAPTPRPGPAPLNNIFAPNATFVTVSPEVLAKARQRLIEHSPVSQPSLVDSINGLPQASELPAGGQSSFRAVQPDSATLSTPAPENGAQAPGDSL